MGQSAPLNHLHRHAQLVAVPPHRLEAGEDNTVSSLMAVLGALDLAMRLEPAGMPSAAEVARRFQEDDDAA